MNWLSSLDYHLPDVIFLSKLMAAGLIGIWKAFEEMKLMVGSKIFKQNDSGTDGWLRQ